MKASPHPSAFKSQPWPRIAGGLIYYLLRQGSDGGDGCENFNDDDDDDDDDFCRRDMQKKPRDVTNVLKVYTMVHV